VTPIRSVVESSETSTHQDVQRETCSRTHGKFSHFYCIDQTSWQNLVWAQRVVNRENLAQPFRQSSTENMKTFKFTTTFGKFGLQGRLNVTAIQASSCSREKCVHFSAPLILINFRIVYGIERQNNEKSSKWSAVSANISECDMMINADEAPRTEHEICEDTIHLVFGVLTYQSHRHKCAVSNFLDCRNGTSPVNSAAVG